MEHGWLKKKYQRRLSTKDLRGRESLLKSGLKRIYKSHYYYQNGHWNRLEVRHLIDQLALKLVRVLNGLMGFVTGAVMLFSLIMQLCVS